MNRKNTMFSLVGILLMMFSCEQEITSENTPPHNDSTTVTGVDSSQLPHNLFWNGHYYLLEFDTAFAWFGDFTKSTTGGHPVPVIYESAFIDKYTGEMFKLFMGHYTHSTSVWSNYFFYSSYEAKQRLALYGEDLIDHMDAGGFGTGIVMKKGGFNGYRVFPNYDEANNNSYNDVMEVISYQTNMSATEVTVDYHIKVTRPNFYLDLQGMFRAQ